MSQQEQAYIKVQDVIDAIQQFFKYILQNHKWIWILALVFGISGATWGLLQKPKYMAESTFILEEKTASGGGLAGLASQFGFDIGSLMGGNAGMFAGDNILDILRSEKIIERVLLTRVDSSKGNDGPTLADHYLDFMKWRKKYPVMANLDFRNVSSENKRLADSVLQLIHQEITKKQLMVDRLNKKGSIIQIQATTSSMIFSKLFAERLLDETMELYIGIKTGTAQANVMRLQERADSLMQALNTKSYQNASLQILDANAAFKSYAVPSELTNREKMVVYGLYSEVIKNLELARMSLVNQTPIMQKLDQPKYPLQNQTWAWWKWMAAAMAVGGMIGFFLLFYQFPGRTGKV